MEIKGIGVDLVRIERMRRVVERWKDHFLQRVFTPGELEYCLRRRDPVPHLAARFAAKEASLKALGTGLRMGISWKELEVTRKAGEPPTVVLQGRSREVGLARGGSRILLSLTHDGEYALAQALLISDGADGAQAREVG